MTKNINKLCCAILFCAAFLVNISDSYANQVLRGELFSLGNPPDGSCVDGSTPENKVTISLGGGGGSGDFFSEQLTGNCGACNGGTLFIPLGIHDQCADFLITSVCFFVGDSLDEFDPGSDSLQCIWLGPGGSYGEGTHEQTCQLIRSVIGC